MKIRVAYVDGEQVEFTPDEWPNVRSGGVNWCEIGHKHFTRISGQSVYWLYRELDTWVMGGGPIGYGQIPPEVIVGADDQHSSRQIEFMPDLPHHAVKLGGWWPGTTNRPVT